MYTLNDFFCGCGGLGLGLQNSGFKIVGAWDFDKYAVETYRRNIGDHVVQADIQELHISDIPEATAWSFGFPCQDLSVAGNQNGIKLECLDCGEVWEVTAENYNNENKCPKCGSINHRAATRSGMFFEIMRLLREAAEEAPDKLPKILIAENVKALRPYIPVLEAEYKKAGYRCYHNLFNSMWWGVPPHRERYIVVGIREDLTGEYTFPEEQHENIPKLSTILEKGVAENFYISDEKAATIIEQAKTKLESLGYCHATITPDRLEKRQNGRRAKEDEAPMFTLTAQDLHGVIINSDVERERTGHKGDYLPRNGTTQSERNSEDVEGRGQRQLIEEAQLPARPRIMQVAHKGSGGQKGWIHCTEGIVGAVTATDYKDPKYILEPQEGGENEGTT